MKVSREVIPSYENTNTACSRQRVKNDASEIIVPFSKYRYFILAFVGVRVNNNRFRYYFQFVYFRYVITNTGSHCENTRGRGAGGVFTIDDTTRRSVFSIFVYRPPAPNSKSSSGTVTRPMMPPGVRFVADRRKNRRISEIRRSVFSYIFYGYVGASGSFRFVQESRATQIVIPKLVASFYAILPNVLASENKRR